MRKPFEIAGNSIAPGKRATLSLPVARLYTHTGLDVPVHVIHGRKPGPCLFVSAAIHGDEINGVEIVRRLLKLKILRGLRGTLIAIPIVNVFGFINHSRYLPDRRDLNRAFPGREKGSLTSRLAHLFTSEIIDKCTHGIDLHTGSNHRTNLPQIRANLEDAETKRLASVFGAPVVLNSDLLDGSLRQAVAQKGIPVLLYEAGEALRFDETSIRIGLRGVIAVMRHLGMIAQRQSKNTPMVPSECSSSTWVRTPSSGILVSNKQLGDRVTKKQVLGTISDPFGEKEVAVHATISGIIIGQRRLPLVYKGDAIYHLASFDGEIPDVSDFEDVLSEEEEDIN